MPHPTTYLLGRTSTPGVPETRRFLTRNGVAFQWVDVVTESRDTWWKLSRDPYPLESSQPGVFVAGDLRHGSTRRVASAVGEGAMAASLIHRYLALNGGRSR